MSPGVDEQAAAIENKELPAAKTEAVKKVKPPKKDKPAQGESEAPEHTSAPGLFSLSNTTNPPHMQEKKRQLVVP